MYKARFESLFLGSAIAAFGIATLLTIAAPTLVALLYGPAYSAAGPVLMIHAWSVVFIFLSIIQIGYDITEGLTWFATARMGAGALINIGLNFVLIPLYGPMGSAIATVCSQSCSSFSLNLLHRGTRPIFVMQFKALLLIPCFSFLAQLSSENSRRQLGRLRRAPGYSPS